jgi:predicted transcriptional regulator of viral defense system
MNARDALARLKRARVPVVTTSDAAALLGQSKFAASKTLGRLAAAGLVTRVRQGLYWLDGAPDPHRLAAHLTAPFEAYVSLHSALFLHGMIEQIPQVIYVVSLARSQTIRGNTGTYSIHHIAPILFGGFTTCDGVALATPEKAIFDVAYLSGGRSRLFAKLPELELGPGFSRRRLRSWMTRVESPRARTLVERKLDQLMGSATLSSA